MNPPGCASANAASDRGHWVIVAPHFDHPGHLGGVRTERFRAWLEAAGNRVTVVRAGSSDRIEDRPWGACFTVKDPLGFYRDRGPESSIPPRPRPPNRVRTGLAHVLFVPDPVVLWARRVVRSPRVRRAVEGADWVLSSSPPESSHLAAATLAGRTGVSHYVDLRDGWLDEPMIPLLGGSTLQQWRHRRLESEVVGGATVVTVTSRRWRDLLVARYPETEAKVAVLPNAYPAHDSPLPTKRRRDRQEELTLLYAGKVHSSRPERTVEQLMLPLVGGIERFAGHGVIEFVGNLRGDEVHELGHFKAPLARSGWRLNIKPPVTQSELRPMIANADGLLLLASSMASIPAKLFDYLPSGRPIFAVTPNDSEVDRLAATIPQLFVSEFGLDPGQGTVDCFLDAAKSGRCSVFVPEEFTESVLQRRFELLLSR